MAVAAPITDVKSLADVEGLTVTKTAVFSVRCRALNSATESGNFGTQVEVYGPDVAGLLACISGQLYSRGLDVHSTKGETIPAQTTGEKPGVRDTFVVTRYGMALEKEEEEQLAASLAKVADDLWRTASKKLQTVVQYTVRVDDDEAPGSSVLYVEGPDAPGLLGAITGCLSQSSCTIMSFGGETLPSGGVRDRFVVQVDGAALSKGTRAPLVRRLQEACRKCADPEGEKGGADKRFTVAVEHGEMDTRVVVQGPDVPGLLSKLSAALASDGYEIVGFEAGSGEGGEASGVRDVFRVVRDGKPLSDEEGAALQQWIAQVSDTAYAESLKLHRSTGGQSHHSSGDGESMGSRDPMGSRDERRRGKGYSLLGCMPRPKGTLSYDERRRGMDSGGSSNDGSRYGLRGSKGKLVSSGGNSHDARRDAELTNLERQGLIAALKQKGEALAMAAEVLMAGNKEVSDDEMETLNRALGEASLSDVMKRAQIDPAEIKVGEVIGAGVFGEVRAGSLHGTPIAIKTMHRKGIQTGGLDLFKAECELCLSLRHPNIVQLIGACWKLDAPTVFLVMERCAGTLSDALREAKLMRRDDFALVKTRLPICVGVARAMGYLHAQKPPILHRDLKPDNVLLTRDNQPKVSDFGSSRDVAKMAMTQVGTPLFSAPEIMAHEPYDGSADVWSFGCLCACVYHLSAEPYAREMLYSLNVTEIMRNVISGSLVPEHPEASPFGDLGRACNHLDPAQRPSFLKLVEMLQDDALTAWGQSQDDRERRGSFKSREGSFKGLSPSGVPSPRAAMASGVKKSFGRSNSGKRGFFSSRK